MYSFVSVIIPVFNDSERLKFCLNALERQTYPKDQYEVLVVDNGSTENVRSAINHFQHASTFYESRRGSYAARNKGIAAARGEILAFTDADCIPAENWLQAGINRLLSAPNCGLVAGRIKFFFKNPGRLTAVEVFDQMNNLQQQKYVEEHHYGATANLFTFKKIFEDVGYFIPQLKSGGDAEWGSQVFAKGYSLIYADDSWVAHPTRHSLSQLAKKIIRQTGGSYDRSQLNRTRLGQLLRRLYELKPPLRSAFRKAFLESALKNNTQRIQLFFVILFAHYVKRIEEIRLLLGGQSKG